MERDSLQGHWVETFAYSLFAVIALGMVSYLFYSKPVIYARLVTEAQWGEYGTAVGFGVAGVLFLFLGAKPGPFSRRLMLALIGLATLFIAGEELSWGQRIFHFSSPKLFYQWNTQGEFNLHNLTAVDGLNRSGRLRRTAGLLILGWSALSMLASLFAPRLKQRIEDFGAPLIPARLLLIFLAVPFLFISRPLLKSDEIGELFFAAGMAAWAVDLCFRHAPPVAPRNGKAAIIMLSVFLSGTLLTVALTWKYPGSLKGALDFAVHQYSKRGMYDQADQIYRYIYAHPRLLKPETRISHARMLLALGQKERAFQVLREDLNRRADGPETRERLGEFLRRRGTVHALLGEADLAETDFARAIKIEGREAELASDPDEKAERLWSVAQSLEARGDLSGALSVAQQANEVVKSGKLHQQLEEWIRFLEDSVTAQAKLEGEESRLKEAPLKDEESISDKIFRRTRG